MPSRRHLYELKKSDLLMIDASYYRTESDVKLRQGNSFYFYCTPNPKLPLVFFHQGNYYINSAASDLAGNAVIRSLKSRFPKLEIKERSICTDALNTESVMPVNYTPDPTTANVTPVEQTVKNWLTIRFYRLDADQKKEYLEGVPYSITDKYQPADTHIFQQGKSPAGGTLEYDNMPSDNFYTVHYGPPGSDKYTEEKLVCLRKEHELKVEEIKVTAKIAAEYKVVLLDKKLSDHQEPTEDKIVTDGTVVELSLEQDPGSPVFDQGAKIEVSGAGAIDVFLDEKMTKELNIGDLISKDKITGGKKLKIWLKGTKAGKFTLKLTPSKSSNGKFIIQPAAEMKMGVVELNMELYEQDIAKIESIQVDPDQEPISDYHTALDSKALPDQIELSKEDKVKKGRLLHVQKDASFGRAKITIKALVADQFPSGCDDYEFTLTSGGKSGKLKLFNAEFDGNEVKLPLKLKKSELTADKTYWVEGAGESNALRDTVLDMGMDRASGEMAKTPKRNGDWGRYSVVKIDAVELDYTQPVGGPNAWDAANKRFFINMQKGDAGRKITIKAKLSKKLENVKVHFMLVEDKNNRTAANWGIDLPSKSNKWVWKDISASVKHLDKVDRKNLLHDSAKTDINGEATQEIKLSQFGGDKFHLAVYSEQDPHLAKYIHDHATLGKRKPVMATDAINVWRKFWHQLIKVDGITNPGVNGAIGQYDRVKAAMGSATPIAISRSAVNGYSPQAIYPMYMVKVNGGNSDALVVSDTNKGQFFTGYVAESDKPIKIPILICDAQWDAGSNSKAASAQDLASSFPIDISTGSLALKPPLQGGDLLVSGDWVAAEKDPVKNNWINVRRGTLSNSDITINPNRSSLKHVTVNIPKGVGLTNATTTIEIRNLVIQGADGPYLGESFNQRILAVYDSSTALTQIDFQNTIAHEIGHAFQQVIKGDPAGGVAGIPEHPCQVDLGQGNHCHYLTDKCVMYDSGPIPGSLNRYCDVCHPYLLAQDMAEIV